MGFLCQLLSPLVAFVAICVASTTSIATLTIDKDTTPTTNAQEQLQILSTTTAPIILPDDSCCSNDTIPPPCPIDHTPAPLQPQCQDPSVSCSSLPLSCISCTCPYSCKYGATSQASCTAHPQATCEGERNFIRQFRCSYCYLTDEETHRCSSRDIGCRSVGSPTSKSHWYIANCTTRENTICLQAGVQQEEGVQLDRGIQLEDSCHSVSHFGWVWSRQILPWTLAGGDWEAVQLWRVGGLDTGGCGPGVYGVYWVC